MKSAASCIGIMVLVASPLVGCGNSGDGGGSGGATAAGAGGSAGMLGNGGITGNSGATGNGGGPGNGGVVGSGGASSGGALGDGGQGVARGGTSSSGGAGGSNSTSGGTLGNGGTTAKGGNTGKGGSSAKGGATSTGGVTASGGAPVGGAGPSTSASRFTAHKLGGSNTAPNGFYEYLPPGYSASTPVPLLVFWHGIGQDGDGSSDLDQVPSYGPPALIKDSKWPDVRPFIVLSPQYTAMNGEIEPGGGCPSSAVVDAFFTWAIGHYAVDPKRIYLTGLSCGAVGSWAYLTEHRASTVAAAVLIAGNPGDPSQSTSAWKVAGCDLRSLAIWSLHGDQDSVVPYAPDHDTLQNLMGCTGAQQRPAMFTDVVGGQHDIWDGIYDLSSGYGDIYQWMLNNPKP